MFLNMRIVYSLTDALWYTWIHLSLKVIPYTDRARLPGIHLHLRHPSICNHLPINGILSKLAAHVQISDLVWSLDGSPSLAVFCLLSSAWLLYSSASIDIVPSCWLKRWVVRQPCLVETTLQGYNSCVAFVHF